MLYLNTSLLIGFGLFAFKWLCRYMQPFFAVCLTLVLVYSGYMTDLKQCIFSDLPCLTITMLYLLVRSKPKHNLRDTCLLILLAVAALLTRTQAIMLLFAEAMFFAVHALKGLALQREIPKNAWYPALPVIAGTVVLHSFVNRFIFPTPATASGYYINFLADVLHKGIPAIVRDNINFLLDSTKGFFSYPTDNGVRTALVTIITSTGLVAGLGGWLVRLFTGHSFEDLFFLSVVLLVLYYPIHDARFLLPVIAVLYWYVYFILRKAVPLFTTLKPRYIAIACTLLILFTGLRYFKTTLSQNTSPQPPDAAATQAFAYLKAHIGAQDIVVCSRPRVLALYTGCRSVIHVWQWSPQANMVYFKQINARYLLTIDGIADDFNNQLLKSIVPQPQGQVIAKGYTLYQIL
jgi:hypothetical protein